jgi:hypothetical protein
MIRCEDYDKTKRIDAATLPTFSNESRCPSCNQKRARVLRPGSRRIRGPHFRRACACGAEWCER